MPARQETYAFVYNRVTYDKAKERRPRVVLTDEQCNRFFDTMDALLLYVNDHFEVVEGFSLEYTGQIGDLKTALVAQTLWENVDIIDQFVRDNPFHLPQNCLDTALAWKAALPGFFTVVRYQNGRALLMNDLGVFSISGVTNELEGEIGKAPAYVELVLLPFDDLIVYDGFLQAFDTQGTHEETVQIQDEFENRCAQGIISTASEFSRVVADYQAARRNDELDALLADVAREAAGDVEQIPEGFHRSVLAGLGELEREAAIAAERKKREQDPSADMRAFHALDFVFTPNDRENRTHADVLQEQALNCAIASVLSRGVIGIEEAYDQYRALVPEPLDRTLFDELVTYEASFSDAYFGLWQHDSHTYLTYYSMTPDYIAQLASRAGTVLNLREELDYYESYKQGLLRMRTETSPKPLPRTLLENTPLGELLGDPSALRLRRFLDERIPDGQDDYTFADLAVQEMAFAAIESGNLEEVFRLRDDLGLANCTTDVELMNRLLANLFNAMPSWENNGWSPQELYEQLTGRRVFYNENGTVMRVGPDDPCPCGSGKPYRSCCGR